MRIVELTSCRKDSYREVVDNKLSDISDSIYGSRVSVQLPIEMLQPPLRTCEIIIYEVSRIFTRWTLKRLRFKDRLTIHIE